MSIYGFLFLFSVLVLGRIKLDQPAETL